MDGFTACPASGEGTAPSTDSASALDSDADTWPTSLQRLQSNEFAPSDQLH